MANGVKICVTLLALTACDLKSTAVDEAVMAPPLNARHMLNNNTLSWPFAPHWGLAKKLAPPMRQRPIAQTRCDGAGFGGKVTIQAFARLLGGPVGSTMAASQRAAEN
jgi:hypothetical protein